MTFKTCTLHSYGAALAVGTVLAVARPVYAEPPPDRHDADEAATRAFDEAVELSKRGQHLEACAKYEESQRLASSSGALVNLGDCAERAGKLGSAARLYRAAIREARRLGKASHLALASERLQNLEPRLTFVSIDISKVFSVTGLRVMCDGEPVGLDDLRVPVDVGPHEIAWQAPDHEPGVLRVTSTAKPGTITAVLEPLRPAPRAPTSAPATTAAAKDTARDESRSPAPAWVVGGAGVAVLAFGGLAAAIAAERLGTAKDLCPSYPNRCPAEAEAPNRAAQTWALVSTLSVGVGLAAIATGVTLLVLPSGAKVQAAPSAAGARMLFEQRF